MDVQLVTQYIVRQTTVLLAQLSTAAGVRAPLAQVADQVFYELARELEAQGVRRNVVADMFGLALRSYQLKMQRLADTSGVVTSLWQDLYRELEAGSRSRRELGSRLPTVEPRALRAVLHDLVDSGLAYKSGRGLDAVYGLTSPSERERLQHTGSVASLANLLWLLLSTQGSMTKAELAQSFSTSPEIFESALLQLVRDGRATEEGGHLTAHRFEIPVGSVEGWEAAVCDHFRAVANAIGSKLSSRGSGAADQVGGSTLTFTVHDAHPKRDEVFALLQRVRKELGQLWHEVSEHNRAHPPPSEADRVTFYFGQNVTRRAADSVELESSESA